MTNKEAWVRFAAGAAADTQANAECCALFADDMLAQLKKRNLANPGDPDYPGEGDIDEDGFFPEGETGMLRTQTSITIARVRKERRERAAQSKIETTER